MSTTSEETTEIEDLRRQVRGAVITAADPPWAAARAPWNLVVDQHPLAVLEAADPADIQAAVRWAGRNGRRVLIQPTGHAPVRDLADTLLIRPSALDGISVDVKNRVATVGAGVLNGALLVALDGTGLVHLAGSNPGTSVTGLLLGGGLSMFGRAHGLACSSLRAATVVDGTGELRRIDHSTPEHLWALRGGGGNVGIVVEAEVALYPAASIVGGGMFWPLAQLPEVMDAFREATAEAPDELTLWLSAMRFPPLPQVPEPLRGQAFAIVMVSWLGAPQELEPMLAPLRRLGAPFLDGVRPLSVAEVPLIAAEPTDPLPAVDEVWTLTDLEPVADDLARVLSAPDSPLLSVVIRHLGGAFARPHDTGAHGTLEDPFLLFAAGVPAVPGVLEACLAAFAELDRIVAPVSGGRVPLNFLPPGGDPVRSWPDGTRERLVAVKRELDPLGVIRASRSL